GGGGGDLQDLLGPVRSWRRDVPHAVAVRPSRLPAVTPVMCLVTDRQQAGGADGVVARAAWAARAGVHLVQVRERDLEGRALTDLVVKCVAAVRGTRTRVVVNERFDVALAAGAHGVHL